MAGRTKTRGAGARRRRSIKRAQGRVARTQGIAPAALTAGAPLEISDEGERREAARMLALARHGHDADPAILAVEEHALMEELAPMPACANCDHAFSAHAGMDGACGMDGCSCNSYEKAEATSASGRIGTLVVNVTPNVEGFRDAVAAGIKQQLDAICEGLPDGTRETIRMRLEQFELVAPTSDVAPAVRPSPEPAAPDTAVEHEWNAILAPEGTETADRRAFAPGSITWREVPLTLMAMIETSEGGHIGAQVCGRIDKIWRDDAAGLIRAAGVFDTGEYGQEIARLVTDKTLRGNSVDLAIHDYEVGPRSDWFDAEGNWAPKEAAERHQPSIQDMLDEDNPDPTIAVITNAEIGMSTVCPFPAFGVAKIAVGESLVAGANPAIWTLTLNGQWNADALSVPVPAEAAPARADAEEDCGCTGDGLTAAAGGAPVAPPAEWFQDPMLAAPTALSVDEDGRITGHAAAWGVCHIGLPGCRTAPHSSTDYRFFHLGEIVCDDGSRAAVGQITIDAPHAGLELNGKEATAHYDNTGCVIAHVRVGEDAHGIWVAGAVIADASPEKTALLRGAKLSGDWRKFPDTSGIELVGLLAVPVPGFPVPRANIVASAAGEPDVLSLVAAGTEWEADADELERIRAVATQADFQALAAA